MVNEAQLIKQDLNHIWHPCTQMKDFELFPPLIVHQAKGSYLYTNRGPIIDAISSWWCKSLGHGHPKILSAIQNQLKSFEHVISANTTHPLLAELGEKLFELSGNQHVFFASDGASAVEIAMKICLHAMQIKGKSKKTHFIALQNSYHGETLATLSVSDLGLYKKPYEGYGVNCHFIHSLPYISHQKDPLWINCDEIWPTIEKQLEPVKEKAAAVILEPLIQGAGGMRCYSADFLKKISRWCAQHDIYLIADEIMTGIGRTGKWLASHHASIKPDIICLSKGLTSGTIPLSAVLVDHALYDLFYDDFKSGNSFLHSHTYSGNALAISAALATIKTIESENLLKQVPFLEQLMAQGLQEIASITGKLTHVRWLGAMVAADLEEIPGKRLGFELSIEAVKRGALLRPLGNTIYWFPPLNTDKNTIEKLTEITLNAMRAIY